MFLYTISTITRAGNYCQERVGFDIIPSMELLGFCGISGCGKDTVGRYIEQQYGFTTVSFADSLKDCLSAIFGWDREMIEGRTPASRQWREEIDPWWAQRLGIEEFTPRFAMTNFGTDVMRNRFNDDIWIFNTERKLANISGPIAITDLRFPNEFELVRRLGGSIARIKRGRDPKWVAVAKAALSGDDLARHMLTTLGIHESEWAWLNEQTDAVLENHTGLSGLYEQVDAFIETQRA